MLSHSKIRGFTLIELLIVIAIILILIAIALPNFLEAQLRARVTAVKGDLRTVGIALDTYFLDFGMYPPEHDPDSLGLDSSGLFQLTSPLTYLKELPEDLFKLSGSGIGGSEQRWYEAASTGVPPRAVHFLRPKLHAYITWSGGPDGGDNFDSNDSWPYNGESDPCPRNLGYINYSPTNGTKSIGDLLQLNGSQNIGFYCIDHHIRVRGPRPF
jgi:prepilin-type N-terminal cleavage/methylation domain-containing protein